MSVLHSVIGRRHLLGSVLVGTIGVLLPVSAAHAGTPPPSPAGTETLAPAPSLGSPNAAVSDSSVIGAVAAAQPGEDMSIRPFKFRASDEALADLKRRIAATKWPNKELVSDASQGVQLATMQKLADYWANQYDWRKVEGRLDALPQFVVLPLPVVPAISMCGQASTGDTQSVTSTGEGIAPVPVGHAYQVNALRHALKQGRDRTAHKSPDFKEVCKRNCKRTTQHSVAR